MRFLQIHTFYPQYLESLYSRFKLLHKASFKEQIDVLISDAFSAVYMFAPYMKQVGYDSQLIIANCPQAQFQWMKENGINKLCAENWVKEISRKQIEEYEPDILYLSNPIEFEGSFIRSLNHKPKLILGWRAAESPYDIDWSGFDVMLSSLRPLLQFAVQRGAKHVELFSPGFPAFIADRIKEITPSKDIVFVGQYTLTQHPKRGYYLRSIAKASEAKCYSCVLHLLGQLEGIPHYMKQFLAEPVFGLAMHKAIRNGRIAFDARRDMFIVDPEKNIQIDIGGKDSANMRIFEATGSGVFLLTEHFENIGQFFKVGDEIETFSDRKELLDKIDYYLAHPKKREEIAARGQARCLKDHSMERRVQELDRIIRKYLADTPESVQPNPPEFVNVATDALKVAHKLLAGNHVADCLRLTSRLKALRLPLLGLDHLRAQTFLRIGQPDAAREALKEELRYFPDHIEARRLLESLTMPEQTLASNLPSDFAQVLQKIRPYTMIPTARLLSLYNLAIHVCREDLPGNMVECGVAAGGSSALLAWAIKRYSQRPRTLFCFDTFTGMPAPTEADTHANIPANETGWGEGTCAAPIDSLIEICQQLKVDDIIRPIKGLFKDTLPTTSSQIGPIALLHMDGDWYESTRDILDNLYDQVVPQGGIQVDDYGHWEGCKKAIHEFEARRGIKFHMHPIDATGVWFQKPSACAFQSRLLNLGCGQRYHPDWTNVDFTATAPGVLAHDLTQGIPFATNSFDAVYHSHLLEHFAKDAAPGFLRECYRVLRPGGIIRVVVPDLENIARLYLILLEKSLRGDSEAQKRYEWIMLELFDQMVRNSPGGAMLEYWRQNPMPAEDFVIARVGSEVQNAITQLRAQPKEPEPPTTQPNRPCDPLAIGKFRLSGEVHQWMYDRYSLGKLLHEAGFEDIKICRADESSIPQFNTFSLDIEADGSVRKPDSLYMEARKPRAPKMEPSSTEKTTSQRPKIAQICAQDFGGAGTAALRLHDGLRLIGVNNSFCAHNIKRWRPGMVPLASSNNSLASTNQKMISPGWDAFCARNERSLARYPNRPPYFDIFTDTWSAIRISQLPEIADADIINFHWIAGTVDVFKELDFLRTKKIVWTLHDMNPFTGGCHYAAGCSKYEQTCGSCPQLGSRDPHDLSRHIWTRKKAAYRQLDITVVAPSQWLADCVQKSSLFSSFPVHVIPNGVPTDIFKPYPQAQIRESLHIPQDAFVVLCGADSLTNSRKGFAYLLQALTQITSQATNHALCLATFGKHSEVAVQHLGLPIFGFGYVENESELALIYSLADVTVLPSLEDNLPNIVLESLACGTPVVGFDVGGIPDMVTHLVNGYLAPVADAKGLVQGINWVMKQKQSDSPIRIRCRATVLTRYHLLLQARSYQKLYQEMMT